MAHPRQALGVRAIVADVYADGADDVTGFEYPWTDPLRAIVVAHIGDHGIPVPEDPYSDPGHFTRTDVPGGSATLSLIPPNGVGPMILRVRSLDRAFNPSATTSYTFFVSSTAPTITPAVPSPAFGEPTTFTLRPDAALQSRSPVVSYSVHMVGVGRTSPAPGRKSRRRPVSPRQHSWRYVRERRRRGSR